MIHDVPGSIDAAALWQWLPIGYLLTVAIEAPVLLVGLRRSLRDVRARLVAACWLTGVTYPVVVIALPLLLWPLTSYATYFAIAEAFAMVTECLLFRMVWHGSARDLLIVALANVLSAAVGWWLFGASAA